MQKISIQIAKNGNPVPLWNGFQLHSVYEPEKEGAAQAEKFTSTVENFSCPLLVLGLGFGYHILPLLGKFQQIYIAESNQELINLARAESMLQPLWEKCQIISNLQHVPHLHQPQIFLLRSEIRFQEPFFQEVQARATMPQQNINLEYEQIRILINFPVYGGSSTTAQYITKALETSGLCVRICDHSPAENLLYHYLTKKEQNLSLISRLTDLLAETLLQEVHNFQPHIVFFTAQSPLNNFLLEELKKLDVVTIYWFVEDFRRFTYWQEICPKLDYFFMIQRGEFETVLEKHCPSVWGWFPMAAEPSIHRQTPLTTEEKGFYGSDISFMGAAYPNRVHFFHNFPPEKLKLWGTGWSGIMPSEYQIPLAEQRITPQQSNLIYQATKININIHSSNSTDCIFDPKGDFVNPRTFEIAACGGFQLIDRRPAIKELFDEDTDLVCFSTIEEALDKINYYLKNEKQRIQIAENSRQKVLQFHTYQQRLDKMLQVILQNSPKITRRISNEQKIISDCLKKINDPQLELFLQPIKAGLRCHYEEIMSRVRSLEGKMEKFETYLLLLDSFYHGE